MGGKAAKPVSLAESNQRIADAIKLASELRDSHGLSAVRESLDKVIGVLEHGDDIATRDEHDDLASTRHGGRPK